MVENDSTEALEWYAENGYRLYDDDDELRKLRCDEILDEALHLLEEELEEDVVAALNKVDKAAEDYHSFEDMCAVDEDVAAYYIDSDACDTMLSDIMVKDFARSLKEKQ